MTPRRPPCWHGKFAIRFCSNPTPTSRTFKELVRWSAPRHSAAVAWLESGVHIKAVADLLGHSSIAITGDIYGHTSDGGARAAVEGLTGRWGCLIEQPLLSTPLGGMQTVLSVVSKLASSLRVH